jgi:hypothetical protein
VGSIAIFITVLSVAYCIKRKMNKKKSKNSLLSDYEQTV